MFATLFPGGVVSKCLLSVWRPISVVHPPLLPALPVSDSVGGSRIRVRSGQRAGEGLPVACSELLLCLHSLGFSLGHVETKLSPSQDYESLGELSSTDERGTLDKAQLGFWSGLPLPRVGGELVECRPSKSNSAAFHLSQAAREWRHPGLGQSRGGSLK